MAPLFTATDIHGNKIALEDYKGKKLMLCFFRYAGCPFCIIAILKLINENYSLMNETEKRLNDLREQLFKDLGPMKKLTITSVLFLFVLSFFLLSSSFTGFVVVPMDEGDTTLTGFVFAITAILGMFIVSRWLLK